tara:strand:+ start:2625 stop:2879 length:255 start_codon:yes stop_codon:yes gene_type:complete
VQYEVFPIGTLLHLEDVHHAYRIIVLDYFPIFFNGDEVWHYTLNFFRGDINLGTLAFEEIELQKLIKDGEIEVLSRGTGNKGED